MKDPDPLAGLTLDATDILLLVGLLAVALIVNNFIQKRAIPIPEAISTILVGVIAGGVASLFPEVNRNTFQKLEDDSARQFMLVFIAPIIFCEGYGMNRKEFFDNITRILVHAFLGTLLSSLVVAYMVFYLPPLMGVSGSSKLVFSECLALGAMLSSTDPVTTLAIFKEQQLAEKGLGYLYYSVLGESILNDAVAITLFDSFGSLIESEEKFSFAISMRMLSSFCVNFLGSTLIGLVGGMVTAFVLKSARLGSGSCDEEEHHFFNIPEIGVVLVLAYVPFLVAQALNLSGIVAIMFAGISMRRYAHFNMTLVTRNVFLPTIELLASLCETYVFLILGLGVFLMESDFSAPIILCTLLGCLIGRAAHVYPMGFLVNYVSSAPKLSIREMHVVWFAGLRGGIAFMCALGFSDKMGHQNTVLCTTMVIVGTTLVFLGWPTSSVLQCLKVAEKNPSDEDDARDETSLPSNERQPRMSWSRIRDMGPVSKASQKLRQLLMTSDAIAQADLDSLQGSQCRESTGFLMGPTSLVIEETATCGAPLGSTGGMGNWGGMSSRISGHLAPAPNRRMSDPGALTTDMVARQVARSSAPPRLQGPSLGRRSMRMLCDP
eukprot:TRINITY_DN30433_c0_g1_i1.p1 TRINITY_DN30433_c0_g1~~TRINITY_DN30433_c0_g1_i1.p1  ORF type:complete len:606 (+),score=74.00 TRINITY_DN30433_c0_g1_i1:98-1915(+)